MDSAVWWRAALGYGALLGVAWLLGFRRGRVAWRLIVGGVLMQAVLALLILRTNAGRAFFGMVNGAVNQLLSFTKEGTRFVAGGFVDDKFTVALHVLPTIVFFSALVSLFYHLGVIQRVVGGIAWVMRRTLGTSGPETLTAAANIFVGPTEAPLLVRPYLPTMTSGELYTVMVAGFATVSGGILGAYVGLLNGVFPDIAGHLLTASAMNAPAALMIAKVMFHTDGASAPPPASEADGSGHANIIDALAAGAKDGLYLALNVAAMLMAFIAFVALVDASLRWVQADVFGYFGFGISNPVLLEDVAGAVFYPFAWLLGTPLQDVSAVANLLGTKLVLNELVAFEALSRTQSSSTALTPAGMTIASYALCGFANFGTVAIQLGGIGTLAPERRGELARFGLRAMFGGALASMLSAAMVVLVGGA